MYKIILKPGREVSLLRFHPWVFSGAIKSVEGNPGSGETVDIFSSDGRWLARGAYSPQSQIRIRVWSFDREEEISGAFFRKQLAKAKNARDELYVCVRTSAYRLVNAESDGLPGVIVDKYGDYLICQFLSAGAEYWKKDIVMQLEELFPVIGIYERSDADVRTKEGLEQVKGILAGQMPPKLLDIQEDTVRYKVDVINGQKTGFYLDQRENRALITEYAEKKQILNCFSYTGGFTMRALKAGAAMVTNIDSSEEALALATQNAEMNHLDTGRMENITGDAFQVLRSLRDHARQFDLVILDPPKFVTSAKQMGSGTRGYKDINLLGMKLIKPGGILFTFSCSGLVDEALFQKIVADAAVDAKRAVQVIRFLNQSADHPVALNFPESRYLKGLVCRIW
jgi:23S rRNA (cytosine1962-C5)-methyltransferase